MSITTIDLQLVNLFKGKKERISLLSPWYESSLSLQTNVKTLVSEIIQLRSRWIQH